MPELKRLAQTTADMMQHSLLHLVDMFYKEQKDLYRRNFITFWKIKIF